MENLEELGDLVKNTATVKGILHHLCLVRCCFFLQRVQIEGAELHSGVEMDVYKRESLWPLEPYNDQELRVARAKE